MVMPPTMVMTGTLPTLRFTNALAFSNRSGLVKGNRVIARTGTNCVQTAKNTKFSWAPITPPVAASITPTSAISGDDRDGDDRAVQGRVNVADLLRDQAVERPGEDDAAAIEEVGLRQVDQGIEPGDCNDPQQDDVRLEDGCVEGDPWHGVGICHTGIAQVGFGRDPLQWDQSLQEQSAHHEDRPGHDQGCPGAGQQRIFSLLDLTCKEGGDVVAVEDPEAHDQASQGHHGDIRIGHHAVGLGKLNASGVTACAHELDPRQRGRHPWQRCQVGSRG